jgi:hypothetical protein
MGPIPTYETNTGFEREKPTEPLSEDRKEAATEDDVYEKRLYTFFFILTWIFLFAAVGSLSGALINTVQDAHRYGPTATHIIWLMFSALGMAVSTLLLVFQHLRFRNIRLLLQKQQKKDEQEAKEKEEDEKRNLLGRICQLEDKLVVAKARSRWRSNSRAGSSISVLAMTDDELKELPVSSLAPDDGRKGSEDSSQRKEREKEVFAAIYRSRKSAASRKIDRWLGANANGPELETQDDWAEASDNEILEKEAAKSDALSRKLERLGPADNSSIGDRDTAHQEYLGRKAKAEGKEDSASLDSLTFGEGHEWHPSLGDMPWKQYTEKLHKDSSGTHRTPEPAMSNFIRDWQREAEYMLQKSLQKHQIPAPTKVRLHRSMTQ